MPDVRATIPAEASAQLEEIYHRNYDLLLYIACRKFRVPPSEAEVLIQEVFVSFLSARSQIRDVRAWLAGAISNASRYYWRTRARTEAVPIELHRPEQACLADTVTTQLTVQETLSRLHEKCRETLRLRYFEGSSVKEVAVELDTTRLYAKKLIANCLKRAYQVYRMLSNVVTR